MSQHHVIDDSYRPDPHHGTGYISRDYDKYPLGGLKCAKMYAGPIYPKEEWKERIEEKTAKKLWITDLCDAAGLGVKDQNGLGYCWIYSVTHAIEVLRVLQGQSIKILSPESAGAKIKNYRNEGGSGIEAAEYIAEHGVCEESLWAPHKLDRSLDTAESRENALQNRIVEWEDGNPDDESIWISAVLNDDPVTVGIPVWGHEVLLTYLTWNAKGFVDPGIDNSWSKSYGNNGRSVLQGRYKNFDEVGVIRSITPS